MGGVPRVVMRAGPTPFVEPWRPLVTSVGRTDTWSETATLPRGSQPSPWLRLSFPSLFFFLLFRAAPSACGSSQARGQIGAIAASLHHSHSQTGSKQHLRLTQVSGHLPCVTVHEPFPPLWAFTSPINSAPEILITSCE